MKKHEIFLYIIEGFVLSLFLSVQKMVQQAGAQKPEGTKEEGNEELDFPSGFFRKNSSIKPTNSHRKCMFLMRELCFSVEVKAFLQIFSTRA